MAQPWVGTALPVSRSDRDFFAACTEITLGDGAMAKFWRSSRCLQGQIPEEIAPGIFKLVQRKNVTVKFAITGSRWIRQIRGLIIPELLQAFVLLWLVREVQLSTSRNSSRFAGGIAIWKAECKYVRTK